MAIAKRSYITIGHYNGLKETGALTRSGASVFICLHDKENVANLLADI